MAALRSLEVEAIRLMAVGFLTEEQLQAVAQAEQLDSYQYTGCGYFLSVKHPTLPEMRKTLSQPAVVGNTGDIQAGSAIGKVAKARGMSAIAENNGLGCESLYKALTPGAKPRYDTIMKVLRSLGVKLSVTAV